MNEERNWGRRRFLQSSACLAASLSGVAPAVGMAQTPPPLSDRWRLGCFTRPFGDTPFADTLDGIAQAGYSAVGLMSIHLPGGSVTLADASAEQVTALASMAAERRLAIVATYYSGPPVQKSLEDGIAGLRKLIDNCAAAGCASVVMGGTSKAQLYDAYYQAVEAVCDDAAQQKVALALKPHGGLNATGPQCRKAIQRVGHPNFRLWYDPGNIYYYSDGRLDPVQDAATVAELVTGMCVKDFQPTKVVALNPGTGKVDFPRVLQTLNKGGFTGGPLVVETLAPGDLATTIANARQTRLALEQWLHSV